MDTEKLIIERSTYALLDWVGDVGGLMDGIYIFTGVLLGGLVSVCAKAKFYNLMFRHGGEYE